MRFLLDVNVGTTIARALSSAGHDVRRVAMFAPLAADEAILSEAAADDRILVTHDRDFTDLIYGHNAASPPAVIYIRAAGTDPDQTADRLLALAREDDVMGNLFVIGVQATRRRRLPIERHKDG